MPVRTLPQHIAILPLALIRMWYQPTTNINLPPALKGGHNLMNIAAAMLICDRLDISVSSWEKRFPDLQALPPDGMAGSA